MNVAMFEIMKSVPPEHFERLMSVQTKIQDEQNRESKMPDKYLQTENTHQIHSPITQKMRTK